MKKCDFYWRKNSHWIESSICQNIFIHIKLARRNHTEQWSLAYEHVELDNSFKEGKEINKNVYEEIVPVETEHDEVKFRSICEKVNCEVIIDILQKEVFFLRADAEEIALQDESKCSKSKLKKSET